MRRALGLLGATILLTGCSDSPEQVDAPEVSISAADWSGNEITIEAEANLPDEAILSWYALEGDDWDDLDAASTDGFATVSDGSATTTIDASEFTADQAIVDVSFVPGYSGQPSEVSDSYGPPFSEKNWPSDWKEASADEAAITP